MDKAAWEQAWKNSSFVLIPLIDTLMALRGSDTITEEELTHPNLHDKMIWDASKRRTIDQIISIIGIDKK